MNKNIIFIGLILGIVLVSGCIPTGRRVLTENPVVINEDISGAPSSPMDLVLIVTQFSEDKTSEITVKVGMRTGYKTEWFEARNTSIRVHLPEGLEIPDCPLPQCELAFWRGDIIGDQVEELKVRVKAVKNGEWVIEASALSTDFPGYGYVGDSEKIYILVEDQRVLISDTSFTPPTLGEVAEIAWIPEYPEEYIIFQDYIKTIGGEPRISDSGTVEATIISITNSEACPYQEEKCRIEPYPKDIGVVRIDKIISYTPYSEQTAEQPVEQPAEEEPSGEVKTTPGYRGEEPPEQKPLEYEPLQVGQEIPAIFILTARPVKIRYVSIPPKGEPEEPVGGLESAQEEPEQTVAQQIGTEPLPKTYKPIPKEGDYFVFTTKIIEYPETSQKILPGLKEGDKFRAEIKYDGSLYVEEYEVIP